MVLRRGIRILATDQLEGIDVLQRQVVLQDQSITLSDLLVDGCSGAVVVNVLRRVRIQRTLVDIGSVRQRDGIAAQNRIDDRKLRRVRRGRRTLVRRGHQHIAIDLAAQLPLPPCERQMPTAPERRR